MDVDVIVVSDTTDVVSDTVSDAGDADGSDAGESDAAANENGDDD